MKSTDLLNAASLLLLLLCLQISAVPVSHNKPWMSLISEASPSSAVSESILSDQLHSMTIEPNEPNKGQRMELDKAAEVSLSGPPPATAKKDRWAMLQQRYVTDGSSHRGKLEIQPPSRWASVRARLNVQERRLHKTKSLPAQFLPLKRQKHIAHIDQDTIARVVRENEAQKKVMMTAGSIHHQTPRDESRQ